LPTQNFKKPMTIRGSGTSREIVCPICNRTISRTLPPHMRKEHLKEWDKWCTEFLELYNKGYSPKQIMDLISVGGRPPFTWSVIANEIRRIAEQTRRVLLIPAKKVRRWSPETFQKERTTVWQFEKRGNWAVHDAHYRGNWPPQIPRNLILHYLKKDDMILDPFVGGGTTLIESRSLGIDCIGLDISPHSVNFSKQKMHQMTKESSTNPQIVQLPSSEWGIIRGDARKLPLKDCSIDFICGQPPYGDAIKYTYNVQGDLSHIHQLDRFYEEMRFAATELHRVLRKGKYCTILIGDIRRKKRIVPLGLNVMDRFLESEFALEEIIIKKQNQERSTWNFYSNKDENELRFRIEHEYLFIFRKSH